MKNEHNGVTENKTFKSGVFESVNYRSNPLSYAEVSFVPLRIVISAGFDVH